MSYSGIAYSGFSGVVVTSPSPPAGSAAAAVDGNAIALANAIVAAQAAIAALQTALADVQTTPGPQGVSGFSGYAGTAGTSGYSGVSGASGASGTSGMAGSLGTAGQSGASGTSGRSGWSGLSGYSGAAGLQQSPTLAQVTAAGATTTNAVTVSNVFTTNQIVAGTGGYNNPNVFNVVSGDGNWAFGCYGVSPQYWMQAKYYDTGDGNRGFRVVDVASGLSPFATNMTTTSVYGLLTVRGPVQCASGGQLQDDGSGGATVSDTGGNTYDLNNATLTIAGAGGSYGVVNVSGGIVSAGVVSTYNVMFNTGGSITDDGSGGVIIADTSGNTYQFNNAAITINGTPITLGYGGAGVITLLVNGVPLAVDES